MKRKANFDVLFAEEKKKIGFTGSNASSITDAQLQSRWLGKKETQQIEERPRQTAMKIYIHIHICAPVHANTSGSDCKSGACSQAAAVALQAVLQCLDRIHGAEPATLGGAKALVTP